MLARLALLALLVAGCATSVPNPITNVYTTVPADAPGMTCFIYGESGINCWPTWIVLEANVAIAREQ